MSVAVVPSPEIRIPAPELRGPILHIADYPELELGFDGPAGSGKTFGILYFIHVLLLTYPGAKWLVARKRNTDLAGSALATYRESILNEHEDVRFFGGSKDRPAGYIYPNGSFLAVNGLDKPGKVKSMDFDGIYIVEATDCTLEDIETAHIRLARRKNSVVPQRFQKLFLCFNPDAPTHFLNERMNAGLTRRLPSRHEDNPFLWDARTRDWTEAGRRYIAELDTLTGVRLARYRYGIWAASEGTVYEDAFDRARNVIPRFDIPKDWPRYLCLDFGFTNPFVCKWYAVDPDGRLYVYREIYRTKRIVEDHVKTIKEYSHWGQADGDPFPREVIADHDAEDRETFTRHSGLYTTAAHKSVSDGIQAVAARLRPAGDGKPRLFYFADALVDPDPELVRSKKPKCSMEEFDVYVWPSGVRAGGKEAPVKENDHGMDCLIAGTMITTAQGLKPIEEMQVGDSVLTRNGYKPVRIVGLTKERAKVYTAMFSDGRKISGTGNHPVYVDGKGYIPLRVVRYGDIIMTAEQMQERLSLWEKIKANQKLSSITVSHLDGIRNRSSGQIEAIMFRIPHTESGGLADSIKRFGKPLTALFQQAITSIIGTKTRSTMHWKISNAFLLRNTMLSMSQLTLRKSWCGDVNGLTGFVQPLQTGIVQTKAGNGTKDSPAYPGKRLNISLAFVRTVEKSLKPLIGAIRNSTVQTNVRLPLATSQALTMSSDPVLTVETSLLSTSTAQLSAVPVFVRSICEETEEQAVYNLTIENPVGEGEYFANGVLVHNCDRYMVARLDLKPGTVSYFPSLYGG